MWLYLVGGFVVLFLVFLYKVRIQLHPDIPTVPHHPILGILPDITKNKERIHAWRDESCQPSIKKGHAMAQRQVPGRPLWVDVLSPECLEFMLGRGEGLAFDNFVKGPVFTDMFRDVLGDGIFNADGAQWTKTRKIASHMFSTRMLVNQMERVFLAHSREFVALLATTPATTKIDLQSLYFKHTMDCICEIAFGIKLDCLHTEVPFANAFDEAQELTVQRLLVPFNLWKVARRFRVTKAEKAMVAAVHTIDSYLYKSIKDRRESKFEEEAEYADLVTLYLQDSAKRGDEPPTDKELRDLIMNFMLAGRDTTACALTWLTYVLSRRPDVEEKLLAEIKEVVGDGEPTHERLKELHYADAVFTEVCRLHPPVPTDSKMCIKDCVFPNGVKIKAGTSMGYSPYTVGRMTSLWGPDALEFRPERWLEMSAKTGKPIRQCVSQYQFIQFNAGPRLCLGKDMAYLEAKVLLCSILPRYRFVVSADHNTAPRMSLVHPMLYGLPVTVLPRAT